MSTTRVSRKKLLERFRDKELRDFFVSETNRRLIAEQIREMRDARGWTQEELARASGKVQETISQLENPNAGKPTLTTLQRLASAFDVALDVRFVSFGELADRLAHISPEELAVPDYNRELGMEDPNPRAIYSQDTAGYAGLFHHVGGSTAAGNGVIIAKEEKSNVVSMEPYRRRTALNDSRQRYIDATTVNGDVYARA